MTEEKFTIEVTLETSKGSRAEAERLFSCALIPALAQLKSYGYKPSWSFKPNTEAVSARSTPPLRKSQIDFYNKNFHGYLPPND